MSDLISLATCTIGEDYILESVGDQSLSSQLYSMGCIPGEVSRIEKTAPLGDPIMIGFEDCFLSIRKEDAKKMMVKKTG